MDSKDSPTDVFQLMKSFDLSSEIECEVEFENSENVTKETHVQDNLAVNSSNLSAQSILRKESGNSIPSTFVTETTSINIDRSTNDLVTDKYISYFKRLSCHVLHIMERKNKVKKLIATYKHNIENIFLERKKFDEFIIGIYKQNYSDILYLFFLQLQNNTILENLITNTLKLAKDYNVHCSQEDVLLMFVEMMNWVKQTKSESINLKENYYSNNQNSFKHAASVPKSRVQSNEIPKSNYNITVDSQLKTILINTVPTENAKANNNYHCNIQNQHFENTDFNPSLTATQILEKFVCDENRKTNSYYEAQGMKSKNKAPSTKNCKTLCTLPYCNAKMCKVFGNNSSISNQTKTSLVPPQITSLSNIRDHNFRLSSQLRNHTNCGFGQMTPTYIGNQHQNYPYPRTDRNGNSTVPYFNSREESLLLDEYSRPQRNHNQNLLTRSSEYAVYNEQRPPEYSTGILNNREINCNFEGGLWNSNQVRVNTDITIDTARKTNSRDSGIISPLDFNINVDFPTEESSRPQEDQPFITHVTSWNENATTNTQGACSVCGRHTYFKCVGCNKLYYCKSECQEIDWSNHRLNCYEDASNIFQR